MRSVWPQARLYGAAFLLDFAVAGALTAIPFLIYRELGGDASVSGTIGAAQMAAYALGCLGAAAWPARSGVGMRWALAGIGLFAVPMSAAPFVGDAFAFGVVTVVPFLGLALAWPALQSWMGGEPDPVARGHMVARFNIATALGFTLGPPAAGPLYELDPRLPFLALLGLGALVALLAASLPKAQPGDIGDAVPGASESYERRTLRAAWGATFTASLMLAALRSVYPMRIENLAAAGPPSFAGAELPEGIGAATAYSWLAFLLSLAAVGVSVLLGRTRAWRGSL